MNNTHHLFNSLKIKNVTIKNRTALAPMTRISTRGDGIPTEKMAQYYRRFAEGGFGLIITEGTYTDKHYAQAYPNQPGITCEKQRKGWEAVVKSTKKAGGKIILQLMHAGALSQHLSNTRSASAVPPIGSMMAGYSEKSGAFPTPHAMNGAEIDQAIEGFAKSAQRAEEAGFDGVEIHGANGYLIDQFLSDYTNQREDMYGGDIQSRSHFLIETITNIRLVASPDFLVGVRVSQGKINDASYRWPGGVKDAEYLFPNIESAGADYIHFASAGKGFEHGSHTSDGVSLPQLAKLLCHIPVIANGSLHEHQEYSRIITERHADMIAIGKCALVNPDWPIKVEKNMNLEKFPEDFFRNGVSLNNTGGY
ncbi:NADH:flavin oxidoreductase [Gilvimarinus sp. SDUM040013]|uniref:NADH:flavin oxidoreductase n=1 Tax=Gilvimarinus gilvus TaxID=3058038 RepID=A0ABU4RWW6_9GAMM|nr:NADH:flavin oxidoreductase [Gilvimarinus sp. SDUM040013]MDO3387942.1 NADH:flavin oxidoreductase [Gilvimarinus sp. SDUM040013]MDX6848687.1 NADH:flavin oxidoreductase [Gilvimarinus sp. SDUM040013]